MGGGSGPTHADIVQVLELVHDPFHVREAHANEDYMARDSRLLLVVCNLAFVLAGCGEDPDPPMPDAGPCPENKICGSTCCSATQQCIAGICRAPVECEAGKSECGADCCDDASETCVDGVCQAKPHEGCDPACSGETPECVGGACKCHETSCGTGKRCNDSGVCEADVPDECTPACNGETPECVGGACKCNETSCGTGRQCNVSGICEETCPAARICGTACCAATETCNAGVCIGNTTGACLLVSTYGPFILTGEGSVVDGPDFWFQTDLPSAGTTRNIFDLQLWSGYGVFTGGVQPGSYSLSGEESNPEDCGLCVTLYGGVSGQTAESWYMPRSGTADVQSFGNGLFTMTLTNVVFQELDWETASPLAGGCTSTMQQINVDGIYFEPTLCDPLGTTPCPTGEGCYYLLSDGFMCAPAGSGVVGDECVYGDECAPGLECIGAFEYLGMVFPGECLTLCSIATPLCPTTSDTCESLEGPVGYCEPCQGTVCGSACCAANQTCDAGQCVLPSAPSNNMCNGAIALTLDTPVSGTTISATADYGSTLSQTCKDQSYANSGRGAEVVYSFTSTTGGTFKVTVNPGSTYDCTLWIAPSVCGAGTNSSSDSGLACIKASDVGAEGDVQTLMLDAVAGTTYYIFVDAYYPTQFGSFSIEITSFATRDPFAPNCGAGQGCYYYSDNTFTCQTAGTVPAGGSCASAECVPGAQCLSSGTCATLCPLGGSGVCTGSEICEDAGVPGIGTCQTPLQTCGPLDFTGCGAGKGCYSHNAGTQTNPNWTYTCQTAGAAAAGTTCGGSTGVTCTPGTDCVTDNTGTKCRPFCDPTGTTPPAACVSPLTCYDWEDGAGNCMQ